MFVRTAFLIMVMIIAILVYTIIPLEFAHRGSGDQRACRIRPAYRGAHCAYAFNCWNFIRNYREVAGSHPENPLVRIVLWPGMQMQRLTTNEPDDSMLECAIEAMRLVLDREKEELQNATN